MRLVLVTCFALLFCLETALAQTAPAAKAAGHAKGTKQQKSDPPTAETPPKPITKYLVVNDLLSDYVGQRDKINTCQSPRKGRCILLVSKTGEILSETASVVSLADHQMVLSYESTAGSSTPDLVLMGIDEKSDKRGFSVATNGTTLPHFIVEGKFCTSPDAPVCQPIDLKEIVRAEVSTGASSEGNLTANVLALSVDRALIELAAEPNFRPSFFHLITKIGGPHTFPFVVARPDVTSQLVFQGFDLPSLFEKGSSCPPLQLSSPSGSRVHVTQTAVDGSLLFAEVTAPQGQDVNLVVASCPGTRGTSATPAENGKEAKPETPPTPAKSILLRRVAKPAGEQSLLDVNMTPMDQETVQRDFGYRIAQHYYAVQLDLVNRTGKKLQFNKSSLTFDVDYRAVGHRSRISLFNEDAPALLTADTFPPNVYKEPFVHYGKKEVESCYKRSYIASSKVAKARAKNENAIGTPPDDICKQVLYRFGIEQTATLSPDNYMAILAAYDYTTEHTDRVLRLIELVGGTLLPLSTGSIIAQVNNTAFRDSVSVLTGTFLPGFRALTLDPARINRLRSNLVGQTMQETVQIPPNGAASTVVLLPRDGILTIRGLEQSVVVDRLVNVHIDPDVVNGVKDAAVPQNHLELGYTADQVRQALGDPPNVTTDANGLLTYTYSKGPYDTVNFNKEGKVFSWAERNLEKQLEQAETLVQALDLLHQNKIDVPTRLSLLNQNTILVDVPGVTKILQYDPKGVHIADYKLLYADIQKAADAKPTVSAFEKTLSDLRKAGGGPPSSGDPKVFGDKITFLMPDIQGGSIEAVLPAPVEGVKDADPRIESISFRGLKANKTE